MTSNPTPDPESARALLWRHGVPEDVIDGALCLHAQELAAVQRREAAVWGVDTAAGKRILGAADLIDPASAAAPAVSSAVGQATRDRIAEILRPHASLGGTPPRYEVPLFDGATPSLPRISGWRPLDEVVDALAVLLLPPPAARAAVLREVEQHVRGLARATFQPYYRSAYATLADSISRMADEAQQQPETTTGPSTPDTPRCAHCTHPKRDHDGRADHREKFSPLVAGDPWCHACNAGCDYAPVQPAAADTDEETRP